VKTRREIRERLAEALHSARKRSGVSQQVLATAIGCTQASLSNYENGRRDMPLTIFVQAIFVLGLDPAEVVRGALKGIK
jgi:transcriptional regulator with XRE-family HTH domain